LVDTYPEIQIIATGSSSFDLANQIGEPLVGRSREFKLYPLSIEEIKGKFNLFDLSGKLENIMRFGIYPSVFNQPEEEAKDELYNIASKYLYKDVLAFENIKNPSILLGLLKHLALQLGNEVSIEEHSGKLDGYEFQYNPKAKFKTPTKFLDAYENSSVQVINSENWYKFLT
jgi:predicted AAA+ superfamily ATPase